MFRRKKQNKNYVAMFSSQDLLLFDQLNFTNYIPVKLKFMQHRPLTARTICFDSENLGQLLGLK